MHDDCTPSANLISHRHSAYDIQSSLQLFSIFTRTTLILPSCTLSLTFLCPVSYFHVPYFLSSCTLPVHVGLPYPLHLLYLISDLPAYFHAPYLLPSCISPLIFLYSSCDLVTLSSFTMYTELFPSFSYLTLIFLCTTFTQSSLLCSVDLRTSLILQCLHLFPFRVYPN